MSIYDKASLVLIPSGTKTSKVYSQKPTNGDGDFTFSRSTAATRVNASGNIEKETSNLLLQSNSFNTTWSNTNSSETGGQSGYDGTSNAWKLTISGAGGFIKQNLITSSVQTYSVYAKADTYNFLSLGIGGGTFSQAFFDLQNGTIGTTTNIIDATIQSVGSGWYRCSVTFSKTTTNRIIYPCVADNDYTGTSGSIFIQNSQSENGLVARDYIETTTTAIYGGITDNVPRLDYTDSSCPALLLEPQRTNLVTQSEYYDTGNGYFNSFGLHDIVTNTTATTSPTGDYSATKIIPDTSGSSNHNIYGSNVTSGTKYAVSIFAKAAEYDYLIIRGLGLGGSGGARFNISTGVVEGVAGYDSATIEDYGNGWYRCIAIGTATSTTGAYYHASPTATFTSFQGNNSDGIYIYGAQVEAGSYATSYIPTYGSAVTRNADAASKTGISDLINDSEGTLFVEASTLENGADCRITISDNTINNRVSIEWDANADTIKGFIGVGGNLQTTSYDQTNMNKIALVYNATDARLFINGTKVFTDSSVPSLSGMDRLEFSNYAAALPFVGNTNKLLILKEKLTDQEAIDLTTI